MTGCSTCDAYGPDFDTMQAAMIELHKAVHDLRRVVRWELMRLARRLA